MFWLGLEYDKVFSLIVRGSGVMTNLGESLLRFGVFVFVLEYSMENYYYFRFYASDLRDMFSYCLSRLNTILM